MSLYLDADSIFDKGALEKLKLSFYLDSKIGGVGGNVIARNRDESAYTTRSLNTSNLFLWAGLSSHIWESTELFSGIWCLPKRHSQSKWRVGHGTWFERRDINQFVILHPDLPRAFSAGLA